MGAGIVTTIDTQSESLTSYFSLTRLGSTMELFSIKVQASIEFTHVELISVPSSGRCSIVIHKQLPEFSSTAKILTTNCDLLKF